MKIAFVYDVLYPDTIGGVEKRIYEMGTRLAERGHEVHLFPMMSGDEQVINREGLIIHKVCDPIGLYTGDRRSVLQALWYSVHLFPTLLGVRVEIIDCQNFPYFPVLVARIVGFLRRETCIITWHEFWGSYWYSYLGFFGVFGRVIEKIAILLSNQCITVSQHTALRLGKTVGKQTSLVPNGITIADIEGFQNFGPPGEILFAGRFIPEKHPELVVEAVRIIAEENPEVSCVMVGDGPKMAEIRALIKKYSLTRNIHLTGFLSSYEELIGRMKQARLFLLPSEREGFGIVCIEALACTIPIITIDHPMNAAGDHVLKGCGYCAQPEAEDIAAGIRQCLSSPPDGPALLRMKEYAAAHDWDVLTTDLEAVYRSCLRKSVS